jgi:nitrogen regulatory protein PII
METKTDMKALYIVVNAGHVDEVMEIIRAAGAPGGTIVHARGESSEHQLIMGISVDFEREVIISIVDDSTAEQIMADIKEKAGWNTETHGICYTMPVEKVIGLAQPPSATYNS